MEHFANILMGDVVRSSRLPSSRLAQVFQKVIAEQQQAHKRVIISALTITLGDEFQGLTRSLAEAFRLTIDISHNLCAQEIRCRFVVCRGKVTHPLPRQRAWGILGPGLRQARERLNEKSDPNRYRFIVPDILLQETLNTLGWMMTSIEEGWTATQLKTVQKALRSEESRTALAKRLRVRRQGLYKILLAANYNVYEACLKMIEKILKKVDDQ